MTLLSVKDRLSARWRQRGRSEPWLESPGATFAAVLGRLATFDFRHQMLCVERDAPRVIPKETLGEFPEHQMVLLCGDGDNLLKRYSGRGRLAELAESCSTAAPASSNEPECFWGRCVTRWRATHAP